MGIDLAVSRRALNALVHDGVHLTRAYGSAICSPARHALVSGRVPLHAGMTNATLEVFGNETCSGATCIIGEASDLRVLTIAQRLSAAGYATHAAGKWGLGLKVMAQLPLQRGFSSYVGYLGNLAYAYAKLSLVIPVLSGL